MVNLCYACYCGTVELHFKSDNSPTHDTPPLYMSLSQSSVTAHCTHFFKA